MMMSAPERLRPLASYEALYAAAPRRFAIPHGADLAAWQAWHTAFCARLRERLGGLPEPAEPPAYRAAEPTQHAGYTRRYLEFESDGGEIVPAWLLIPEKLDRAAPAVVAVHGHGYGVDDTVGIEPGGGERAAIGGYHQDFARTLCRRGFVVLAPELRGFGRRREAAAQAEAPDSSSCHAAAWWALMLGKTLLGSRVADTRRAIDLLQSLPEVDAQRIGMMGGSGGGAVTLMASALDPRVGAVVICNYFCTFRHSILAMQHCHCNYVPGILEDGEMYDIAALIAPRPLLIEAGAADPIFPLPGVLEAYEQLQGAYATLGASERLERDIGPGGHQISGARAFDFLGGWLGPLG